MTFTQTENKVENTLEQDKVDTIVTQPKIDANLTQKSQENKTVDDQKEDPNWRAFREARKKDRAEKEAAEKIAIETQKRAAEKELEISALKAAMEAAFKANPPQQQYYSDQGQNQHEETEDERIEKKVNAAVAAREAAAEKARIEREHQEYPNRLTRTYPDFHQAISQDNLDYLDYHYPEVSRPLQRLQDGYDKWSDIYQAIKKFVPNNSTAKKEAARAESNQNKPKSISSTGITQPGEAVNRTSMQDIEAKRAARYMEMQKIMKSV